MLGICAGFGKFSAFWIMSKVKYHYDPESLSFKRVERQKGKTVGYGIMFVLAALLAGLFINFIAGKYVATPREKALSRELANNPKQQEASAYARRFQQPDAANDLTAEGLAFWVTDPDAREKYIEAFRRSSFEGMLNYYKANYPRTPYQQMTDFPKVKCSVLMIHGLKDTALLPGGLNDTWQYVEQDLTLITVPDASHFVQQDAADLVTREMVRWLTR